MRTVHFRMTLSRVSPTILFVVVVFLETMDSASKQILLGILAFWQLLNFALSVANSVTLTNNYESCSEDITASMSLRSWLVADATIRWMVFYVALICGIPLLCTALSGQACFSCESYTANTRAIGLNFVVILLILHFACSWLWASFGTVLLLRSTCGIGNEVFRNVAASVSCHWIGM